MSREGENIFEIKKNDFYPIEFPFSVIFHNKLKNQQQIYNNRRY